ncbi:hypothetical protein J2X69_004734 [Algoriphagus sp. 4150]|nr:hypothetical protein [Algoriphagus sp. 4150]
MIVCSYSNKKLVEILLQLSDSYLLFVGNITYTKRQCHADYFCSFIMILQLNNDSWLLI